MKSITFDTILYVKTIRGGRSPEATEFGFVSDGVLHEGIIVPGKQVIEAGLSVTAFLRKENDWNSLVGWINNNSGVLAVDDDVFPALMMPVCALTCLFYARLAVIAAPVESMQFDFYWNSAFSLSMGGCAAFLFWRYLRLRSVTNQLKQVRRIEIPPSTDRTPVQD